MTTSAARWKRRSVAACSLMLFAAGTVALVFSIAGAYDRAAASAQLASRVNRALDALCAYQRGGKLESDHRYNFSQVLAAQDAKGWRAAADTRRVSALEAAAAGRLGAARVYLITATEYDRIADAITLAASRISLRPSPPCPS